MGAVEKATLFKHNIQDYFEEKWETTTVPCPLKITRTFKRL